MRLHRAVDLLHFSRAKTLAHAVCYARAPNRKQPELPRTNRRATPIHSTALLLEGATVGFKIASNTMRGIFLINLILGILFWTGNEPGGLKLLHMLLGIIFVAALW